jgi:site-specific DNA recombinase
MSKELTTLEKPRQRAALYLRVSTNEQAENGRGLDVQEAHLRKYCDDVYKLSDVHIYVDKGYSGSLPITKRPALSQLYEDAKAKQFDVVLIYRLDRYFRSLRKLLDAVADLDEMNIGFKSINENFDTTTLNGKLMLQIMGSLAEYERGLIAERMGSGRESAASEGKWVTGVPPYGYIVDKETKKLVINEDEAKIVKQFYHWLVNEKLPLAEIARRANELKISPPKHLTIKKRYTYDIWWKRTIHRILVNEVYTGEFYYRKYKRPFRHLDSVLNTEHQRPKSEWIPLEVPQIIPLDMFKASIKQLVKNKENAKRNTKRPYLFAKLLYCGYTGHKLQSGYNAPKVEVDSPTFGKYYHTHVPEREGARSNIRVQYGESRLYPIWECLVSILQDPVNTLPKLEEYTFRNSNRDKTEHKMAQLDTHINESRQREGRVIRAYMDGGLKAEDYARELAEARKRTAEFEKDKKKLQQLLMKQVERKDRDEVITKLFIQVEERLDNATYEEKQQILNLFVERITLFYDHNYAEVVFKFPSTANLSRAKNIELVSRNDDLTLTLHVKTLSREERGRQMFYGRKKLVDNIGNISPAIKALAGKREVKKIKGLVIEEMIS